MLNLVFLEDLLLCLGVPKPIWILRLWLKSCHGLKRGVIRLWVHFNQAIWRTLPSGASRLEFRRLLVYFIYDIQSHFLDCHILLSPYGRILHRVYLSSRNRLPSLPHTNLPINEFAECRSAVGWLKGWEHPLLFHLLQGILLCVSLSIREVSAEAHSPVKRAKIYLVLVKHLLNLFSVDMRRWKYFPLAAAVHLVSPLLLVEIFFQVHVLGFYLGVAELQNIFDGGLVLCRLLGWVLLNERPLQLLILVLVYLVLRAYVYGIVHPRLVLLWLNLISVESRGVRGSVEIKWSLLTENRRINLTYFAGEGHQLSVFLCPLGLIWFLVTALSFLIHLESG